MTDAIADALKAVAGALRDAGIPFVLGGTLASWARGGPGSEHDVDILVRPKDADEALAVLERSGLRTERPPEGWLYKAFNEHGVMIDLIFAPAGFGVDDALFARADEREVVAMPMRVLTVEDLLVTKLAALQEHQLDYGRLVEIARALREQIAWGDLRARAPETPFTAAFFALVEGLGIAPQEAKA